MAPNHRGYYGTCITRPDGSYLFIKIHRAVAENYCSGDETKDINHIDGDKSNNRADNLEFVTDGENKKHAAENQLYNQKLSAEDLVKIMQLYEAGVSQKDIAERFGVVRRTINGIVNGKERVALIQKLIDSSSSFPK